MERRRAAILEAIGIDRFVPRGAPASGRGTAAVATAEPAAGPPVASPAAAPAEGADVAGLDWDALEARVAPCTRCGLSTTRTQTVFGVGRRDARWMVIGEAPGADEDRQGEPFVGRAGQLLNAMLRAAGFPRDQVYIANILKCRPPGNRDPQPDEVRACLPFLQRQIALVNPRLILCVGRIAAQNLLGVETPIGQLRGRVHRFAPLAIPVIVTYHPAYLLRSPGEKRKSWADLRLALETADGDGA